MLFRSLKELDVAVKQRAFLLANVSKSSIKAVRSADVIDMLKDDDEEVRRALTAKLMSCWSKKELVALGKCYLDDGPAYFYNVVYWLDFAKCYRIADVRRCADKMLDKDWSLQDWISVFRDPIPRLDPTPKRA